MVLAALEDAVSDPSAVLYYRIYSWWILVQCWGTLRFSDHRGFRPADVLLDSEGFVARLTRSKTIGSDRAVTMMVGRNLQRCSRPELELDGDRSGTLETRSSL